MATPCVTRRIRRHGVDCLCCSQWLMQMQWQVTPLNFAPFLFCGLFQKNQRRPAQPDLPDRLRVRRWKRVSMTATLIQSALAIIIRFQANEMGPSNGKPETAALTSLQRSVSTRTSRIKMLLSMVGPCFRTRSGGSLC